MGTVRNRLSAVTNRVLRPFDACLTRRSSLESLEARLHEARREIEALRSHAAATVESEPAASGNSQVSVPLYHHMTLKPLPASHVFRRIEAVIERHHDDLRRFVERLTPLLYGPHLARVPPEPPNGTDPYWNNGFFEGADARAAYALTTHRKPGRIVEVGGGNSTNFFRQVIRDHGLTTRLVSIDPYPRAEISAVSDEVIRRDVLATCGRSTSRCSPRSRPAISCFSTAAICRSAARTSCIRSSRSSRRSAPA
jgi:hypothetical protein